MKKKNLLLFSALTVATPTLTVLASCTDEQSESQATNQKYNKNLEAIDLLLEKINLSKVSTALYREASESLTELKEEFETAKTQQIKNDVIDKLVALQETLLRKWSNEIAKLIEETKNNNSLNTESAERAKSELESYKVHAENEKTLKETNINDLKLEVENLKRDLALATKNSGSEAKEELEELKKNYLPRQRSGKLALIEAQSYLIEWYQQFINFLKSFPVRDEQTRTVVNSLIRQFEGNKQSTELALETTKNLDEKYETRRQFRLDLAITMERIYKVGQQYKNIFNYDLPYGKSSYLEDLYNWRIENLKAAKAAVEANDASVYGTEQRKATIIQIISQVIELYESTLLSSTNYASQLFNYVSIEENYTNKYFLNTLQLDQFSNLLRINTKMTEYPLYNRIYDSSETEKLDVFYRQTLQELGDFLRSEGNKYLFSLAYRKLYNKWNEYKESSLNYKYNAKANTYLEILGTFTEASYGLKSLTVSDEEIAAKKAEIEAKNEELWEKTYEMYSTISSKSYDEDSEDEFKPWTDLRQDIRTRLFAARRMSSGTFMEAFDKYIAFELVNRYTRKMLDLYTYWTIIGDDPKSDELEALLKLKSKSEKLYKRMNSNKQSYDQAKAEKEYYEAKIFPLFANIQWDDLNNSSSSDEEKVAKYKEIISQLKTAFDSVKNVADDTNDGYQDYWFREDMWSDNFESKNNEVQEAYNDRENVTTENLSSKTSLISYIKEFIESRKNTLNEDENTFRENYENAKAAYENSDTFDPKNYTVPNQELYAFIRQWNIKYRGELSSLSLDPENEYDRGALELFQSYSKLWSFGKEDTSTQPYIHITNLDIDDIINTDLSYDSNDQILAEYTPDKIKAKLLELEKAYFEANENYLNAKSSGAENTETLKAELVKARKAYYDLLNDPHYTFSTQAYAKYTLSHYQKGNQVTLSPVKLASIFASEVASYEVLKLINDEYIKDSEN